MVFRSYSKKMQSCARTLRKRSTPEEAVLWKYLRDQRLGVKFRRQVAIDDKYIVDFVCLEKKLVIEVDGSQHAENPEDEQRTDYLKKRGFKVLRFWNREVNQQLQMCLDRIWQYVYSSDGHIDAGASPSPALRASSPSRGEGNKAEMLSKNLSA